MPSAPNVRQASAPRLPSGCAPRGQRGKRSQREAGVTVVGAQTTTLRDFYHLFLRAPWSLALAAIVGAYHAINAVFAVAYVVLGGVAGAKVGSFFDAFCFSVQTMGTVGYGAMYPASLAANVVVIAESVTSLIVTAVATGLVFAKFSRSTARVAFSTQAVIGPMDGVPTLMLRVGNERGNAILEATIRMSILRTEKTKEGSTFYRMYDLQLTRERSPAMARSWTVLHPIVADSPLFGATPESAERDEIELVATLVGVDDTSLQPVHARRRYGANEIVWGARHADVLSEDDQGNMILDVRRFHDIVPTEPFERVSRIREGERHRAPAPGRSAARRLSRSLLGRVRHLARPEDRVLALAAHEEVVQRANRCGGNRCGRRRCRAIRRRLARAQKQLTTSSACSIRQRARSAAVVAAISASVRGSRRSSRYAFPKHTCDSVDACSVKPPRVVTTK